MKINYSLLGDILLNMGAVSREQLDEAIRFQLDFVSNPLIDSDINRSELISKNRLKKNEDIPMLGQILMQKGFIKEDQLSPALEIQNGQEMNLCQLSNEKLATALKVGFIINSTIDIVQILSLIMKFACTVTDAEASTLMLINEKTGELVFSVPIGPNSDKLRDIIIPPDVGVASWVAKNQQYALVPETKNDPRFYSLVDDISGMESRTLLCVPMRSQRRMIGVLEVVNKKNNAIFNEEDAILLSVFSHQAAIAIENAMLLSTVQNRIEKEKFIEKRIAESERIRSIGTLAGGIAHDFNNILSPIVGHTEMLLDDFPDAGSLRDSLKEIYSGALRARDLVKQILAFARQEKNELKPMKMQPIIKEAMKLIRSTIPTTIAITQHLNPDCGSIKADPTQIHQIVMNLATNAYHAMEKNGGKLKIDLKEIELGKEDLMNPDMTPGLYACLSISDTGVGMSKDVMNRIFDPFFTTKEKGKGTGMGLPVVHGIVKHMNGDIQVCSEPGKGTEFHIYLPVVGSASEKQDAFINTTIPGGLERILLVDDEEGIIVAEKQVLERMGYHVSTRTSSIEALEAFRTNPDKFDLVITDMSMPKMSGDILANELIKIRPDIPILLCTGFSESMTDEKIKSLGLKGILMKPIMMKDLAQKIREVLDESRNI